MADTREIHVPELGVDEAVEVIEIHVAEGDAVTVDQPLITLESDKASMEVPSPSAGVLVELLVTVGDRVSSGSPIARLRPEAGETAAEPAPARGADTPVDASAATTVGPASTASAESRPGAPSAPPVAGPPDEATLPRADESTGLLVLGGGPGGYAAAFRAADLGLDVTLVERRSSLGGVCLNVGCIPSKALLHAAALLEQAAAFERHGIRFGRPRIDRERLAAWKDEVVARLTGGLAQLAERRGVSVIHGEGTFDHPHRVRVRMQEGTRTIAFRQAIVATGSRPLPLKELAAEDPRLWTSDDAVRLAVVPRRLLVVGGGVIGLEMAQVYAALGSRVSVVELTDGLLPGVDRDLVRPLEKRLRARCETVATATRVTAVHPRARALAVTTADADGERTADYDAVLVAVGRQANGDRVGLEQIGVHVDERGRVPVDEQRRTSLKHVFAIGDLTGPPMLAHKATHEGKVAAEVAAGLPARFDARCVPAIAYTDPEVAWVGLTEEEARRRGLRYERAIVPWAASGRALGMDRPEGLTKALFEPESQRLLGVGIVGAHAGDLISEAALAIEMGADASDLSLTIHPHPTLSETLALAAELVEGTATDLLPPGARRRRRRQLE